MADFDIGKFIFFSNPRIDIINQIQSKNYFGSRIAEQLCRFFRETSADYIPQQITKSCREYEAFKKIYVYRYRRYYNVWYCHMSAPFFALMHKKDFDFYFGFCHELYEDTGLFDVAMLHSFVISKDGELYDPHIEVIAQQSKEVFLDNYGWYFGTRIPHNVAYSIFCSLSTPENEECIQNFWGYMMEHILICPERTTWFIDVINNDGVGWELKYK